MRGAWVGLPAWIFAVTATWFGRWGERRWVSHRSPEPRLEEHEEVAGFWSTTVLTGLIFLSLLPAAVLSFLSPLLPFSGARAGLAVGMAAFLFGCVPARLLDLSRQGWDRTLWRILVDLLRVGGSLTLVGWLVVP